MKEFWNIVPSVLWFMLVVVLLVRYRDRLASIIEMIVWRIQSGAPVKLSTFELGAVQISVATRQPLNALASKPDVNDFFYEQRQSLRDINLFLVHRLSPSTETDQLYDVLIYLVPGQKFGTLLTVASVDYYFGSYWNKNVFSSIDRAKGFSISTPAFAPFTCTARINFTTGQSPAIVHRYIDFEMGPSGSAPKS